MGAKKILKIAGYGGFTLAALLVSLYLTFPAEAVGRRLEQEVRQRTHGKLTLELGDVSLYRLTGIEATDVKLTSERDDGPPLVAQLDRLHARLQLLPLLLLHPSLSAGAELGGGSVDVVLTRTGDGVDLQVELESLDLSKQRELAGLIGLPLAAKVGGNVETVLALDEGAKARRAGGLAPERSEGDARLTLDDVSFGPGSVQDFTIPGAVSLGSLKLGLEMRRGRLLITSFEQKGGQLAVDLSGSCNLRPDLMASSLDACVKLKFTDDAYLKKYPKIAAAVQIVEMQLRKDGQGYLNLPLAGTLGSPRRRRGICSGGPRR